jgi:hypothetical protein
VDSPPSANGESKLRQQPNSLVKYVSCAFDPFFCPGHDAKDAASRKALARDLFDMKWDLEDQGVIDSSDGDRLILRSVDNIEQLSQYKGLDLLIGVAHGNIEKNEEYKFMIDNQYYDVSSYKRAVDEVLGSSCAALIEGCNPQDGKIFSGGGRGSLYDVAGKHIVYDRIEPILMKFYD